MLLNEEKFTHVKCGAASRSLPNDPDKLVHRAVPGSAGQLAVPSHPNLCHHRSAPLQGSMEQHQYLRFGLKPQKAQDLNPNSATC